jgi:D-alanyl-D-alanine carboxypeptidase
MRQMTPPAGRLGAVLVLLLACLGTVAAASPLTRAQIARIDAIARRAMAQQHLSGVEIGIGRNGRLLFARGYGLRDRARHAPVDASTVFALGSVSKSFTATAVMLLVQSGRIALDAPIARYLPGAPHGRHITVRELLDQTSGLPDYLENAALYREILTSTVKPRSIAAYVAMVARRPLQFAPGSKWAYSNTNYAILGLLIEKITGEPYARFLQDRIFSPLSLNATQVMQIFPPPGSDVAVGYTYAKGRYVAVAPQSMSWANAAGSVASDVHDVIAFDGALFGGDLVSRSSLRTMLTPPPNRPMVPKGNAMSSLARGYGFAWVRGADEGRRIEWHNGGLIGGRTMNAVWPADGLEVVVLTNATAAMPENVALEIARVLYAP